MDLVTPHLKSVLKNYQNSATRSLQGPGIGNYLPPFSYSSSSASLSSYSSSLSSSSASSVLGGPATVAEGTTTSSGLSLAAASSSALSSYPATFRSKKGLLFRYQNSSLTENNDHDFDQISDRNDDTKSSCTSVAVSDQKMPTNNANESNSNNELCNHNHNNNTIVINKDQLKRELCSPSPLSPPLSSSATNAVGDMPSPSTPPPLPPLSSGAAPAPASAPSPSFPLPNSKQNAITKPPKKPLPLPFQVPILAIADTSYCERSETVLEGETIACFEIGGEKRLCFPRVLNSVLGEFNVFQINKECDTLQIYCSRCTPEQLNKLKDAGDIPSSVPSCGLIKKTDAYRLVAVLIHSFAVLPNKFTKDLYNISFKVYHECFGKSCGICIPHLYVNRTSRCIECLDCYGMFSVENFVSHAHKNLETTTVHWGFECTNWRHYMKVAKDQANREKFNKILDLIQEKYENSNSNSNLSLPHYSKVCGSEAVTNGKRKLMSSLSGPSASGADFPGNNKQQTIDAPIKKRKINDSSDALPKFVYPGTLDPFYIQQMLDWSNGRTAFRPPTISKNSIAAKDLRTTGQSENNMGIATNPPSCLNLSMRYADSPQMTRSPETLLPVSETQKQHMHLQLPPFNGKIGISKGQQQTTQPSSSVITANKAAAAAAAAAAVGAGASVTAADAVESVAILTTPTVEVTVPIAQLPRRKQYSKIYYDNAQKPSTDSPSLSSPLSLNHHHHFHNSLQIPNPSDKQFSSSMNNKSNSTNVQSKKRLASEWRSQMPARSSPQQTRYSSLASEATLASVPAVATVDASAASPGGLKTAMTSNGDHLLRTVEHFEALLQKISDENLRYECLAILNNLINLLAIDRVKKELVTVKTEENVGGDSDSYGCSSLNKQKKQDAAATETATENHSARSRKRERDRDRDRSSQSSRSSSTNANTDVDASGENASSQIGDRGQSPNASSSSPPPSTPSSAFVSPNMLDCNIRVKIENES